MRDVVLKVWEMPVLINSFSLAILLVLLMNNHKKHHEFKSQKYLYFQFMVIANMALLLLDCATWLIVGGNTLLLRKLNFLSTTLYYVLDPLPSYFFICFADTVLNIPAEKKKKLMRWYLVPVVLHMVIAILTPYTGWFFQFDSANEYHRGSLLWLSFLLSYGLMVWAFAKTLAYYIRSRRENQIVAKNAKEYGWLLKFTFIPLIGGVIQIFDFNVTYVWNVTVIALLVIYINYQNSEITTDTLTGLYNRRQAFAYFDRFLREQGKDKANIALIMMDINNFKSINDRFGHSMGDEAIVAVARCLEKEFEWDDFLCRFGGDEFVVITKHGSVSHLKAVLQRVNDHLTEMNAQECCPFELSLSAGYALYSKKNDSLDSMFQKADAMMFEQKAKLMRRSSDRRS
jgi:diguanylate cyclase (GGDEF)-like protein